jgi:hypothetical protein
MIRARTKQLHETNAFSLIMAFLIIAGFFIDVGEAQVLCDTRLCARNVRGNVCMTLRLCARCCCLCAVLARSLGPSIFAWSIPFPLLSL